MLAKEELRKKPQAEPGLGRGIHLPQPVGGKGSETGKKKTHCGSKPEINSN